MEPENLPKIIQHYYNKQYKMLILPR